MMHLSRRIAVVAFTIYIASNSFAVIEPSRPALTNFDLRQQENVLRVPAKKREAALQLQRRIPQAVIDFDEITGSPRRVATTYGFLTGPNGVGGAVSEQTLRAFDPNDSHRATKAF